MRTVCRVLASVILVAHLVAMAASALAQLPGAPGEGLRAATLPWEKTLGVHQGWPMFRQPDHATTSLRVLGQRADGTEAVLQGITPVPGDHLAFYDRRRKYERFAAARSREYLRTAMVRWSCREQVAAGDPMVKIEVQRVIQRTPDPGAYNPDRSSWPVVIEGDTRWNCRR